ncbi:MAG: hypothetical protein CMK32_12565 [Porticoccaceae bacterium]|nr:hypothetical protein [Porticoccaceae bacterium]
MTFLCERHTRFLSRRPELKALCRRELLVQGYTALENDNHKAAIHYFGACFELTDLCLGSAPLPAARNLYGCLDQLMLSGHLLAESLGRLGHRELEYHYLLAVHHRLTKWANRLGLSRVHKLHRNLEISLLMLKRYTERHGYLATYRVCREETEKLIHPLGQCRDSCPDALQSAARRGA